MVLRTQPLSRALLFTTLAVTAHGCMSPKNPMHTEVGLWEGNWIMGLTADLILGGGAWSEEMVILGAAWKYLSPFPPCPPCHEQLSSTRAQCHATLP